MSTSAFTGFPVELHAPKSLHSKAFVNWCLTRWRRIEPLHRWLVDTLQ